MKRSQVKELAKNHRTTAGCGVWNEMGHQFTMVVSMSEMLQAG